MSIGDDLYINNDNDRDVRIGRSNHPSDLEVTGNLIVGGGIGRLYRVIRSFNVPANRNGQISAACSAGDVIVGCTGFTAVLNNNGNLSDNTGHTTNFDFMGASTPDSSPTHCQAYGRNRHNAAQRISAEAYCFSPNG